MVIQRMSLTDAEDDKRKSHSHRVSPFTEGEPDDGLRSLMPLEYSSLANTPNLIVVLQMAIQRVTNATVLDHLVEFSALMLRLVPRDYFPA